MDQAERDRIAAVAAREPHFALSEDDRYKLHRVCKALDALSALTCPENIKQAREEANPVREDLAALFEIVRVQVEEVVEAAPFLGNGVLSDLQMPTIYATSKH